VNRLLAFAFVLVLVGFPLQRAESRLHGPDFILHLAGSRNSTSPDSAVWNVGEPVRVIVTMINQSKRNIHCTLTNPAWDWEMDVRDSKGSPVAETDLLRQMKEDIKNGPRFVFRNILVTLRPSEEARDVIEVQTFYDLSRPGDYSVQIQRKFPEVTKEPIKSNRLLLTITP
jgi:hypothetical protein